MPCQAACKYLSMLETIRFSSTYRSTYKAWETVTHFADLTVQIFSVSFSVMLVGESGSICPQTFSPTPRSWRCKYSRSNWLFRSLLVLFPLSLCLNAKAFTNLYKSWLYPVKILSDSGSLHEFLVIVYSVSTCRHRILKFKTNMASHRPKLALFWYIKIIIKILYSEIKEDIALPWRTINRSAMSTSVGVTSFWLFWILQPG